MSFEAFLKNKKDEMTSKNKTLLKDQLLKTQEQLEKCDHITPDMVISIMKANKIAVGSRNKMKNADEINKIANSFGTSITALVSNDTKMKNYAKAPIKQTYTEASQIDFFNSTNSHNITLTKMKASGSESRCFVKEFTENGFTYDIASPGKGRREDLKSSTFDAKTSNGDYCTIKYQGKSDGGSQILQRKNVHSFIEMAYFYVKDHPENTRRFYVIVDGPNMGTKYIHKYREQIEMLGMTDRIFAFTNQEVY
jgi:hypothetical protein